MSCRHYPKMGCHYPKMVRYDVELSSYMSLLAKRRALVASTLLVSMAVAVASILLATPSYQAESRLFVSTEISTGNINQELFQGSNFSTNRVKSYTELVDSPVVLDRVIKDLDLPLTAPDLAKQVDASVPLETVIINIEARSDSPQLAAALADSVAGNLATVIEDLETSESRGSSPVKATVVTKALVPISPVWPNLPLLLVLGFVVGSVLAVCLALLLENLNTSVKAASDLDRLPGLPVLASVVRDRGWRSSTPIVRDDPQGARGEAYRQLRTNLQFAAVDVRPKVILVTSALAAEGKSSVAGNLALALSQVGARVCLLDGDMRRPSVAKYFGLVGDAGLSTVLIGRATIDEVLQPAGDVWVITSGTLPPNPAELLSSARFREILRELSERFDTVVIDSPPALPAADAAVLAAAADAVLLVVRSGKTTFNQLAQTVDSLDKVGARILGAVLNRVQPKEGGMGTYTYRSGYAYQTAAQSAAQTAPKPAEPATPEAALVDAGSRNGVAEVNLPSGGGTMPHDS